MKLAKRGFLSLFCIDEAHSIAQASRCFRTEFVDAVANAKTMLETMPHLVPRIIMSATLRSTDQSVCTSLLGGMTPNVMYGSIARCGTVFSCIISGQSTRTLKTNAQRFLKSHPHKQQIWYSNSKKKAEGAMIDTGEAMLDKHATFGYNKSVCRSFTGDDGIMMKSFTMDPCTSYATIDGTKEGPLQKIQILTATSSANCGISSNELDNAFHEGFPPTLYELLQERVEWIEK